VTSTLPRVNAGHRLDDLRAALGDVDVPAVLVTDLMNVRYLCGFSGSAGRLLVLPDEAVLVTDGRYGDQAAEEIAAVDAPVRVLVGRTQAQQREHLAELTSSVKRLGVEGAALTVAEHVGFAGAFAAELVVTNGLVERLRTRKDDAEIARIEHAAAIADAALAEVVHRLGDGIDERTIAAELDFAMRRGGADGASFETIVAAGPNSAFPHHRPNGRRIVEGDLVIIDFGALVDGYHSDMTRTFTVGEPSPQAARLYAAVAEAENAGLAAIAPGVRGEVVHDVCRDVLARHGLADHFLHGTGHGVGLRIHESPWLTPSSTDVIEAGNVVTCEPGVYLVGIGGVRIEDAVVVTDHGCRPVTRSPKDQPCLPSPRTT
jgi:Xaa-Pro aminopeptidase